MKRHSVTIALVLTLAALITPAGLEAQFTTFVPKPTKTANDSTKAATVAAARSHADSVTRMSIMSMKQWVDSAAGTSTATTANDTTTATATAVVNNPTMTAPNVNTRSTTTTFSNGAIAPNTASPLPAYLAAGFVSLTAGLMLFWWVRRRGAEASKP